MSYIGNNLQVAYPTYKNIDDISGSFDGVTTSFPLTVGGVPPVPAPLSSNQCLISVGGVVQRPDDTGTEGFRLSGGNIIFSAAPAALDDFFGVILAGADYVNVGVNYPSGTAAAPSITFDTDLDTGLYNPGANQVGITTGGTSRLIVDSSGNVNIDSNTLYVDAVNNRVGVGTTSPVEQLHVSGSSAINARFESSGTTASIRFANSTASDGYIGYTNQNLTFTVANAERARIDSSGRVGIGITNPAYKLVVSNGGVEGIEFGPGFSANRNITLHYNRNTSSYVDHWVLAQNHVFSIGSASTEVARIDSSGRLLVGTSSARTNFNNSTQSGSDVVKQIIEGADGGFSASLALVSNRAGTGNSASLIFAKSNATALNSNTLVSADTSLGTVSFQGSDGTEFVAGAQIQALVDGAPNANTMPGRLVFSTTSTTPGASPTERMRIDSSGNVGINTTSPNGQLDLGSSVGTAGVPEKLVLYSSASNPLYGFNVSAGALDHVSGGSHVFYSRVGTTSTERARITSGGYLRLASAGIQFNGATAAASALNDYEEGTFIPTIIGMTTAGTGTYSVQLGRYTKIGRVVHFYAYMVWSAHTGSGLARVDNLPIQSENTANAAAAVTVWNQNWALTANNIMIAYQVPGTYQVIIQQYPVGGGAATGVTLDTAASLMVSGHYVV